MDSHELLSKDSFRPSTPVGAKLFVFVVTLSTHFFKSRHTTRHLPPVIQLWPEISSSPD